jgi:hypothetical protein
MPFGKINYDDPQFQKLLAERAARRGGGVEAEKYAGLYHAFTQKELKTQLEFMRLGEAKKMTEANLDLANRRLDLREQNINFNKSLAQRKFGFAEDILEDQEDDLMLGTALGLGTSLVAGIMGKQRADAAKADAEMQRKINNKLWIQLNK